MTGSVQSFSPEQIEQLTPAEVAALAARLEADDYRSPFEGLQDWHLLRSPSAIS